MAIIKVRDENGDVIDIPAFVGPKGDPGRGIKSIARTSGNGAAGTTDTYTIVYTDNTSNTFQVRNGSNGAPGQAATLEITGVTALAPGAAPTITEAGDSTAKARKYALGIPAGKPGDKYTLTDADKQEIAGIIDAIPDYVVTEAEAVLDRVLAVQGKRTFTLAHLTDLHYGEGGYTDGILHACQALEYIDQRAKLDAIGVTGDYTDGYPSTGIGNAMADFRAANALLSDLRFAPNLRQQGNHDYYADNIPITRRLIQYYSDDVVWGSREGGYYHRDFGDYKLRIICPNCNENNAMDASTNRPTGNISITVAQAQWFADTLAALNDKSDAAEWQVLVLSHQPLDWYDSQTGYVLAKIVDAYQGGRAYSGNGVSCDFTGGKNAALIVCNIHGHIHNLLVDKVHTDNVANGKKSGVWRMATPAACINRDNQYTGAWQESTSYPKTINTAKDTAFVIYCIDLDTYTIHAICYGAGYDRTLNYSTGIQQITYNITNDLTNVATDNGATTIDAGASYTAKLTPTGAGITSVVVTMGGVDVTESVYANGTITINSVTGNIVITAVGEVKTGVTNLIPLSINADGSRYNGDQGWKTGIRLSSSGAESTSNATGIEVTGFMPVTRSDTVYLSGITIPYTGSKKSFQYFALYNSAFERVVTSQISMNIGGYGATKYDANDNLIEVNVELYLKYMQQDEAQRDAVAYFRISAEEINANSVITVNEPIE